MEASVKQKRRWLIEFGLVSLVPVLLVGLFLGQAIRSSISGSVVDAASDRAQAVADLEVQRALGAHPDPGGGIAQSQQDALDRYFQAARARGDVAHVVLRSRSGTIAYADNHSVIGDGSTAPSEAHDALAGAVASQVTDSNGDAGGAARGRVPRVFAPLRAKPSDRPNGSLELWVPYEPIAARITSRTHGLYWLLGGGLFSLWLLVVGVVAGASQRLRRQAAEKEEQALSDGLTGLPNRTMFQTLIERAMAGVGRRKEMGVVMLMDLDRFKDVNDTLGHHNGDLLLQRIGSRLNSVLRDTETVARLGGDEFAILLPEVPDRQSVVPVVRRVLKVLEEPVVVGGLALQCEGSIGIAIFPEHGTTVQTGLAEGVEALARWHHPERGLLSPDEFIPLAERSNLLRPMTLYLLDSALRQCNAWRTRGLAVSVAVNLSMQNLIDLRLPNDLARLVTSWRLPPGSLELEITESTIMADHRRAMTILTRLNKMGVSLTVDDFGTGYSSLAYLQSLPVSSIKIDKSFVLTMAEDPSIATIVQSTIHLVHNLGLKVVAEGVENVATYKKLAELGCDYAQGFFLSRPLSPEKATVWLEEFTGVVREEESPAAEEPTLGEWMLEAPIDDAPLDEAPLDEAPLDETPA